MRTFIPSFKIFFTTIAIALITSCGGGGGNDSTTTTPTTPPSPPVNNNYKTQLSSAADFQTLQGSRNELKVILPIEGRDIPTELTETCYFQNTATYPLHINFLRTFNSLSSLSNTQYESMILPLSRSLWSGELRKVDNVTHPSTGENNNYLYIITTDENTLNLQATAEEIITIDKTLKACMPWASNQLIYTTSSQIQDDKLNAITEQLNSGKVAWLSSSQVANGNKPIDYSKGEYYGYLKWFESGESVEDVGPFDVVISERASNNISLIAGIVTQFPQTYLSHLNIRLREKKIPSAHFPNVLSNEDFKALSNQLVHIVVADDSVTITAADLETAQAFWANRHPDIGQLTVNLTEQQLLSFAELRHDKATAYGSKASNLGELYQALGQDDAVIGFGIPTYWYDKFIKDTGLANNVETLLNDQRVYTDAAHRKAQLKALRNAIKDASLSDEFMQLLRTALTQTFGDDVDTTRIRFRSSTNAEDLRAFSGAGLYDSKSGCLADMDDDNEDGPSLCLSTKEKTALEQDLAARKEELASYPERTWLTDIIEDIEKDLSKEKPLNKAVLKVWASLWTLRAFDEREYYKLDHRKAYMGIAVNKSFVLERREAVVISNEQSTENTDERQLYRVNTQLGSIGIVKPDDPTAVAEEMTFRRGENSQIEDVNVLTKSSLSPDADLWDAQQKQVLANKVTAAHDHFASEVYSDINNPAFDIEVEVLGDTKADEKVFLKQLRPYLSSTNNSGEQSCPTSNSYVGNSNWPVTLTVEENVALCYFPSWGKLDDFSSIIALKNKIDITAGNYRLPNEDTDSILSIPMCIAEKGVNKSTMSAQVKNDFSLDLPLNTTSVNSFYQANTDGLLLSISFPKDSTALTLSAEGKNFPEGISAVYPATGPDDNSRLGNYHQCQLPVNQRYQVEVAGVGSLLVEHHYWAGTAGAGFVAPVRISGTWRGQTIDINNYQQMTVRYSRHAFNADLQLMFDAPIEGEYGIRIDNYIFDYEATVGWTLNADGETVNDLPTVTTTKQE